jgi:transcriptional regulator with XRE-family HTH domain
MPAVFELMSTDDVARDIGANIRMSRIALGLRQEDLAVESGASLQAIKNLEAGKNVALQTFLKVARALRFDRGVWESSKPKPTTLDEIERIEHARQGAARVRTKA